MPEDKWLSIGEAAERIGVHPNTLRTWADKGIVPVHKLPSGYRRFRESDVAILSGLQEFEVDRMFRDATQRFWEAYALELEDELVKLMVKQGSGEAQARSRLRALREAHHVPPRGRT